MDKNHLGRHYLREWRKFRGLSLRRLADRMEQEPGIPITSFANLGRIEKMQQQYSQEIMEAAATALDCTVADLLTINPLKEGKVIDMLSLLRNTPEDSRDAVVAFLETLKAKQ